MQTVTSDWVRFTRSGWRICSKTKAEKKIPYWNCWRRGVCTNTSKRIRRFVRWFPCEYIGLCGVGPLMIELTNPGYPRIIQPVSFAPKAGSHRKLAGAKSCCLGTQQTEIGDSTVGPPVSLRNSKNNLQLQMKLFKWNGSWKQRSSTRAEGFTAGMSSLDCL